MKSGYQSVVLALSAILALSTLWRNQDLQAIGGALLQPSGAASAFHSSIVPVGKDALFVAAVTFLAGLSDDAGKIMVALMVALWLLHLMGGSLQNKGGSANPTLSKINPGSWIPV